jgi:hypothetical protein
MLLVGELIRTSIYVQSHSMLSMLSCIRFFLYEVILYSLKPCSTLLLRLTCNPLELIPYLLQLGNMEIHGKLMEIKVKVH